MVSKGPDLFNHVDLRRVGDLAREAGLDVIERLGPLLHQVRTVLY